MGLMPLFFVDDYDNSRIRLIYKPIGDDDDVDDDDGGVSWWWW